MTPASGSQPSAKQVTEYVLRHPTVWDGAAMAGLVRKAGVLEANTCYAYLLLCTHFADTCLIAERDGEMYGFVAAYRPPAQPDTVFVWQIGVHPKARGTGLGKKLLSRLVTVPACQSVRFLEATVDPSNEASQRLFRAFARDRDVSCVVGPGFEREAFGPTGNHSAEELYRIGPLLPPSSNSQGTP